MTVSEKCKRCGGKGSYEGQPSSSADVLIPCVDCHGTGSAPTVSESGNEEREALTSDDLAEAISDFILNETTLTGNEAAHVAVGILRVALATLDKESEEEQ